MGGHVGAASGDSQRLASPQCNQETGQCVACTEDAHCPTSAPVCNAASGLCGGCTFPGVFSAECSRFPNAITCDDSGSCVECRSGSDCPNGLACASDTNTCVPCSSSLECADQPSQPYCIPTASGRRCVECLSNSHCTHGCDTATNACHRCASVSDCSGSRVQCSPYPGETTRVCRLRN